MTSLVRRMCKILRQYIMLCIYVCLQDQLESELDRHCKLLTSMTSLSYELGTQLTAEEREKISKDRENIKSRLDSLTNGMVYPLMYIINYIHTYKKCQIYKTYRCCLINVCPDNILSVAQDSRAYRLDQMSQLRQTQLTEASLSAQSDVVWYLSISLST